MSLNQGLILRLREVRRVGSLLYGTRNKLFYFEFVSFCDQKYAACDRFRGTNVSVYNVNYRIIKEVSG